MKFLVFSFLVLGTVSAYCGGTSQLKLVNEQEMVVDNAHSIEILYQSQQVTLLKSNSNSLILKEYMNEDYDEYYADVIKNGNKLIIKGNHPVLGLGTFRARAEVYIPAHYTKDITITTISGRIVLPDEYTFSEIVLRSTSGSVSVNSLTVETANITTTSGRISLSELTGALITKSTSGAISGERINGNISAGNTSGRIEFDTIIGSIEAGTISGRITCSFNEITGDIKLSSTSGRVELVIPQNSIFSFSARKTSGRLSTPFSDKLSIPVSDRGLTQGIIGDGTPKNNIDIRTTSGAIDIGWRN